MSSLQSLLSIYFAKPSNIAFILRKLEHLGKSDVSKTLALGYEFLALIQLEGIDSAIEKLKADKLCWSGSLFQDQEAALVEENNFLTSPYELSEGILKCRKCECQQIFSCLKQTRSADEPMTTFAFCSNCSHKWVE